MNIPVKVHQMTLNGNNWDDQLNYSKRRSIIKSIIDSNEINFIILQSTGLISPNSFSKADKALKELTLINKQIPIPIILCNDLYYPSTYPQYLCSKDSNREVHCNIFNYKEELLSYMNNTKTQLLQSNKSLRICDNSENRFILQDSIGFKLMQLDLSGHPTVLLQKLKAIWIYNCLYNSRIEGDIIASYLIDVIDNQSTLKIVLNHL